MTTTHTITEANNVYGHLIYCHGSNTYMFRVYSKSGDFKDYDIRHCDLSITITDPNSAFYEYSDGRLTLDHSPETLGLTTIQFSK